MTVVETPQTRCRAAIARCDITPPVGCYHRMWGAATHDRSTGVHKPLLATLLWLEPESQDAAQALLIISLDHCLLDSHDIAGILESSAQAADIPTEQVVVTFSHTHAAGFLSRSRLDCPGGELILPYLNELQARVRTLAGTLGDLTQPASILYANSRSRLASHRDYFDADRGQYVCGHNPDGRADDTLLVGKIVAADGKVLATFVNYACHPTTLAWENTLISPDYIGALRETIEQQTLAPCLFLQGASGDLGPRQGFVGDPAVADSNGRELAFASLAAIESLPAPGTQFVYAGPVVSGATLGIWRHEPVTESARRRQSDWQIEMIEIPLAYRPELPTKEASTVELAHWREEEQRAIADGNAHLAREAHAHVERMTRQLWKLSELPPGRFPLQATLARLGEAIWVFVTGEHYQVLQLALRERFPRHPVLVATISNGWQPGYIPSAPTYGQGIYQEQIAVVARGSLEQVIASIGDAIERMIGTLSRAPGNNQ
jgi:hypothetical protein